jgi:hypothetical protein
MQIQTPVSATEPGPVVARLWCTIVLAFGFGLSVAWISLLGYELVRLIGLAI